MKKSICSASLILFLLSVGSIASAQNKSPWIHLEVKENKADPELVKVNLPLSMLDVVLDIVKDKKLNRGRLKLDSNEISVAEMKQLWNELKKAGNAEFITVEKKNETVRIARQGDLVLIKVISQDGKQSKVDIKVPVSVVDALLEGPGDELDLKAALLAMSDKNAGEILTVDDDQTHVRIWID